MMIFTPISHSISSFPKEGLFTLHEINRMEGEMYDYLDWNFTVGDPILSTFEKMVRHDFKEPKPSYQNYPNDLNDLVSRRALPAAALRSNTLRREDEHNKHHTELWI